MRADGAACGGICGKCWTLKFDGGPESVVGSAGMVLMISSGDGGEIILSLTIYFDPSSRTLHEPSIQQL
jgi:hypothetical protein